MGGGHSTPPPQIIYQTDPNVQRAAEAAQAAAKAAAETNAALQRRLQQMESQHAQNQQQMAQKIQKMTEDNAKRHSAEMKQIQDAHQQQVAEADRKRAEMEEKFRREMASAAEENRAALAQEQEQHRAEQARLEEEARQTRLAELMKQNELVAQSMLNIDEEFQRGQAELKEEEESLETLRLLLMAEMNARARFEHIDFEGDVHKVVMLGNTGDGKSTLCNRLMGDKSKKGDRGHFVTGSGTDSVTQTIKSGFTRFGDIQFCLADTPGGGDSGGNDRIHATNLVNFLRGIGSVDSFMLVRNVTNKRINKGDQEILSALSDLLGEGFWNNVIIVFTRVDDEDIMEDLMEVERQLPNVIKDLFGLPRSVVDAMQVVGIGKRNYEDQIPKIFEAALSCNNGTAFTCADLVAPVELRQAEFDEQQQVVDGLRLRMHELAMRKGRLEATQEQIQNIIKELSTGVVG